MTYDPYFYWNKIDKMFAENREDGGSPIRVAEQKPENVISELPGHKWPGFHAIASNKAMAFLFFPLNGLLGMIPNILPSIRGVL